MPGQSDHYQEASHAGQAMHIPAGSGQGAAEK
jgi:hypothetical protein